MQTKWFDEELNLKFNRNVLARHLARRPDRPKFDGIISLVVPSPPPTLNQGSFCILCPLCRDFGNTTAPLFLSLFCLPGFKPTQNYVINKRRQIDQQIDQQQSDEFLAAVCKSNSWLSSWDFCVSPPDLFPSSRDVMRKHVSSCLE